MRRTMMALLAGLLFLPALAAADESGKQAKTDKPSTPAAELEALKKELTKTRTEYYQAFQKAETVKERQELRDKNNKQIGVYARRALELAHAYPKDAVAVDALTWILGGGLGYQGAGPEIESALELLRTDHITSDKLERVCAVAYAYDSVSTKSEQLYRALLEKNPHRAVQAFACFRLANVLQSHASAIKRLRESTAPKDWEKGLNADVVKRLKDGDPDKLLKEAEKLYERVIAKYGDVKYFSRGTLGEEAKSSLFEMRYLAIGKTAPEIEGEDIDGKRFKLSDYRGKVVVLDFWGHW